ncbi:uncharacterized protein LOC124137686 isoform X1 [Haliotis rufescens]|uniref:uncharacterized protein LOC124137686 isoform X1 n=1 Tax=Haliotis rufescens TaxID=6454 RepID=UPI001EAF9508|nr:uncharacterized protein LOC124137686 isoform X1 [Haliotis rufescens]
MVLGSISDKGSHCLEADDNLLVASSPQTSDKTHLLSKCGSRVLSQANVQQCRLYDRRCQTLFEYLHYGISDTSVTARKTGHFGSLLLSMRCAFCRRQGNQPCIDRVCSLISESH